MTIVDGPALRVVAVVGDEGDLDSKVALRESFSMRVGSVAVFDEALVVRHYLALPVTSPADLDHVLRQVPREAARLRLHISHGPGAAQMFTQFAD